jgi:hypothetical protein
MGIDGSEIDDQFARLCSSHPLIGPQPGLGTSVKVSSEVFMNWKSSTRVGHRQSIHGRRQVFNKLSAKKARQLQYLSRNQLRIMTELQTGHCHLKGHPFKLELVNSPDWQMQADNLRGLTHSLWLSGFDHIKIQEPGLSFYETRCLWRHLSVRNILHFVQGVGLLNEWAKGLHKRLIIVTVHRSLWCPPFWIPL